MKFSLLIKFKQSAQSTWQSMTITERKLTESDPQSPNSPRNTGAASAVKHHPSKPHFTSYSFSFSVSLPNPNSRP